MPWGNNEMHDDNHQGPTTCQSLDGSQVTYAPNANGNAMVMGQHVQQMLNHGWSIVS